MSVIADLVEHCSCVVDVGCDHGLLCLHLLESEKVERCIACDISLDCLKKVPDISNIDKRLGDGLQVISLDEDVDYIVIAGMGGITICEILQNYFDRIVASGKSINNLKFVLSPQSHVDRVRHLLLSYGINIERDFVLHDYKFYDIILAKVNIQLVPNSATNASKTHLEYGMYFDEYNEDFVARLKHTLQQYTKALNNSKDDTELQYKISKIKDVLKWQK